MKVNTFTTILSIALAAIVAFFLIFYVSSENKLILGIGSFITLTATLVGTISISFDYERATTLTRTVSGVFFLLLLASQIVFTTINSFLLPTYVLVSGSLTIIYVLIVYGISRSKH
jgi:hypothetical protein